MSYKIINGQRVPSGTATRFHALAAAFKREFGLDLLVTSGVRSTAEQEKLFLSRYRVQLLGSGPYRDVRWYRGKRYVRISPAGTVAAPGTSKHETQPGVKHAALDVRDSGKDAGVTVAGTRRANWLRANATRYGLNPAGYGFGEPWHVDDMHDPWTVPAATSLTARQRRTTAILNGRADATSKSKLVGKPLKKGEVGNFVAWKHGEKIDGDTRWVKGTSGRWFALAYLTPRNVDGLADLNPKAKARPTLRRGSRGSDVGDLQRHMKRVYPAYAGKIAIDNIYGPDMERVMREFQRRSNLKVTGIVDPATWKKLGL